MNTTTPHGLPSAERSLSAPAGDDAMTCSPLLVGEPLAYRSRLPAMTFGQLRTLSRAGTSPSATIRQIDDGYIVEFDIGPTRWILISTHSKRPRLFQHVDGAASAIRLLGAHPIRLALRSDDTLCARERSLPQRS